MKIGARVLVLVCAAHVSELAIGGSLAGRSLRTPLLAQDGDDKDVLPPGVTPDVERSIERGFDFLLRVRRRDTSRGHSYWGKADSGDYDENTYRGAITSLVGLAFLARGNTPSRGPHADVVREITEYLIWCGEKNRNTGLITSGRQEEERPMYTHGLAMTFLGQVYGQDGDLARRERIRKVIQRAIQILARSQTDDGGWGYLPNYYEDEGTLTVVQLQGLRVCRDAGFQVPKRVIDNALQYIRNSTNPDGSVRYRVRSGRVRHGVTCATVVALWNAGDYDSNHFRRVVRFVNTNVMNHWRNFASWDNYHHGEFICYYLAQAQWVQGGQQWERFYPNMTSKLIRLQHRSKGYWEGYERGRNYGTAIALLAMQLPYNRLPVYQR